MHDDIGNALGISLDFSVKNEAYYPSCFPVSDLASAVVGALGAATHALIEALGLAKAPCAGEVIVDQRLASLWFGWSIAPQGWSMPPIWDAVAGDYQTRDGWIRLHTNFPRHRRAALEVLGANAVREQVAHAVRQWEGIALETAIIQAGGVCAVMRSEQAWASHPQGSAVSQEPLIDWQGGDEDKPVSPEISAHWQPEIDQPLKGLRVLDVTRVLAGPVATRSLAGLGASVLRIDPSDWEEANVVPDITIGKKCARLDLEKPKDRVQFEVLLQGADILVHGLRPGALDGLGYNQKIRTQIAPHLLEVSLNAYGWGGPWAARRGFDSLVQMSSGIAHAGMCWKDGERPVPLPVQALDHATGYLMAASVLAALAKRQKGASLYRARLSLARTAHLLVNAQCKDQADHHPPSRVALIPGDTNRDDYSSGLELTQWGPAQRLRSPVTINGHGLSWNNPACELGTSPPNW